jgi:hypothetical protein
MEKEWIPVVTAIAALLGAIVGGGIAALTKVVELRSQRKQEARKLYISKLEELYEAIWNMQNMTIESAAKKKLNMPSVFETRVVTENLLRIERLMAIYMPEIVVTFSELQKALENFESAFIKDSSKEGEENQELSAIEAVVNRKLGSLLNSITNKIGQLLR